MRPITFRDEITIDYGDSIQLEPAIISSEQSSSDNIKKQKKSPAIARLFRVVVWID